MAHTSPVLLLQQIFSFTTALTEAAAAAATTTVSIVTPPPPIRADVKDFQGTIEREREKRTKFITFL
jgi:hypothetical protein